jgi:hypothetical protein
MPLGLVVLQLALGTERTQSTLSASALLAAAAFVYPFVGLLAERAPLRSLVVALIYGPVYAAWRVWLALVVRSRQGKVQWIRTRRAEEAELTR